MHAVAYNVSSVIKYEYNYSRVLMQLRLSLVTESLYRGIELICNEMLTYLAYLLVTQWNEFLTSNISDKCKNFTHNNNHYTNECKWLLQAYGKNSFLFMRIPCLRLCSPMFYIVRLHAAFYIMILRSQMLVVAQVHLRESLHVKFKILSCDLFKHHFSPGPTAVVYKHGSSADTKT